MTIKLNNNGQTKFVFKNEVDKYYVVIDIYDMLDSGIPIDDDGDDLDFVGETTENIEKGQYAENDLRIRILQNNYD